MISVIIPVFNCEKYISSCLDSVLNQTFRDFEIIAVDDCSSDGSLSVIRHYAEINNCISVVELNKRLDVFNVRKTGIEKSHGDYVAFLDADDLWEETKLEKQVKIINSCCADLIYTAASCINDDGTVLNRFFTIPETVKYEDIVLKNNIVCSSVLIKKELVVPIICPDNIYHEDYYLWLQILKHGQVKARGINEPLVFYRLRKASKSWNKIKSVSEHYRTLKICGVPIKDRIKGIPVYAYHGIKRYLVYKGNQK